MSAGVQHESLIKTGAIRIRLHQRGTGIRATDFSACVALLAELRKTEKFTISYQVRADLPAEKTISFTDLTISVQVHGLVFKPPRVP